MTIPVLSAVCDAPPAPSRREVLRYMRGREGDAATEKLAADGLAAVTPLLRPRACYARFPLTRLGERLDLGFATVESRSLCRHLAGCRAVLVMAATVGSEVDRLLMRLAVTSPALAVAADAAATAAVEAWCDRLCDGWAQEAAAQGETLRPRFSAGYGDCPLSLQTPLTAALDTVRKIGLTLTDSLLMTPQKSVTALVGVAPVAKGE